MEEEEENMCDGAIYTPIPVGALGVDPRGVISGICTSSGGGVLSGGLQLGGVISGG